MPEKPVLMQLRDFLRGLEGTPYADETIRAISVDVRSLENYAKGHIDGDMTRSKVLSSRMVMDFIEAGENKATIIRRLYSMRRLVEYALENGFVDFDFLADVSYLTFFDEGEKAISTETSTYITDSELDKILLHLKSNLDECVCCSLYVLLGLYLSGLSGQEARGVTVGDVYRASDGRVMVEVSGRVVPISRRLDHNTYWQSVMCMIDNKGLSSSDNFSVFTSQQTILYYLNREAAHAGVDRRVRLVDFRRRSMLDLTDEGLSPEDVADHMGMNSAYVREVLDRIQV